MLTETEVYLAALIAAGHTDEEAYVALYDSSKFKSSSAHALVSELKIKKKGIQKLADAIRKVNMEGLTSTDKVVKTKKSKAGYIDFSEKANVIAALSKDANEETDSIRRAKILQMIGDLMRMKQEEEKDSEDLIHFYLPLTCHQCSLYKKEKQNKIKKEVNDEDSNRI